MIRRNEVVYDAATSSSQRMKYSINPCVFGINLQKKIPIFIFLKENSVSPLNSQKWALKRARRQSWLNSTDFEHAYGISYPVTHLEKMIYRVADIQ